jgi:hypothetical protein
VSTRDVLFAFEVVAPQALRINVTVQCALDHGLVEVVDDLIEGGTRTRIFIPRS